MGRELRRVPLDFDYPINKVWYGYYLKPSFCHSTFQAGCEGCRKFAQIKGIKLSSTGCPDFHAQIELNFDIEPPKGEGYQLWETTSEGSPKSPVFKTLEELCEWCEEFATTFADYKATKEQWKSMFERDFVCHEEGNAIFF